MCVCGGGYSWASPLRAYLSSPLNQMNESITFSPGLDWQGWHIYQTHPHWGDLETCAVMSGSAKLYLCERFWLLTVNNITCTVLPRLQRDSNVRGASLRENWPHLSPESTPEFWNLMVTLCYRWTFCYAACILNLANASNYALTVALHRCLPLDFSVSSAAP